MRAALVGAFSSSFSLRIVLDWEASVRLVGYSSPLVRFVLCSTAPRAREESSVLGPFHVLILRNFLAVLFSVEARHAETWFEAGAKMYGEKITQRLSFHYHKLFLPTVSPSTKTDERDSGAPSSQSLAALHMPSRHYTAA